METKTLEDQLVELKTQLENTLSEKAKTELNTQIKALEAKIPDTSDVTAAVKETKADVTEIKGQMAKVIETVDKMKLSTDAIRPGDKKRKSFSEAFADAVEEKQDEFVKFAKEGRQKSTVRVELKNFDMDTKTVGNMLLSGNLTGDQVASYGSVNGLIPADQINMRDLIPTTRTSTGLYVYYREGAGEGAPARQTEGSGKAQVDSDFTEVKVVQRFLAAYQRFSKQMAQDLPWVQTTLARILLRKFYQAENVDFYTTLSTTSTGNNTTSGGNVAEKIIDLIANQRSANYSASNVLIDWASWAALMKTAYPSTGDSYSIPGGVTITPSGTVMVAGTPITPASWVTASDIQIIDSSYIERVEVDALSVELSFEDADNFTKNLVTARIECREELNMLRLDAHTNYGTAS